jgi:hypothetical protein
MKSMVVMLFGVAVFALSLSCVAFAQQDVNFYCKNDCLARSGTLGACNALCSTTDSSGAKTKDTDCLSSCISKGNQTAYSCYSACKIGAGSSGGRETPAPQPDSNVGDKALHE